VAQTARPRSYPARPLSPLPNWGLRLRALVQQASHTGKRCQAGFFMATGRSTFFSF